MVNAKTIREISERNVELLRAKPHKGQLTCATTARIEQGMRCRIEEGTWVLNADMPAGAGGEGTAPTPGVLGRGALASCVAIGIQSWAARLDIPIDAIEVEVQADFDARGELGMGDVPAGYTEVRYHIAIDSPADRDALLGLLDTVERHSPYLDIFSRPQPLKRSFQLNGEAL